MCGIAGIVGTNSLSLVTKIISNLIHRGPDADGIVSIPELNCTIGHTRLSIIDTDSRSNQPFTSQCDRYIITYNGEIYNYQSLRKKLMFLGHDFLTHSDTELLLKWLIEFGREGLNELDGMFAFSFIDKKKRTMMLVRDQIGEKPLYYTSTNSDKVFFGFASEIKSLLSVPEINTSIDEVGITNYLRFLYSAPPNTLYSGIKELEPGHFMIINLDNPQERNVRKYFDLEDCDSNFNGYSNYVEAVNQFREVFFDSVKLRLRADVPVGIYLSGGLDSNSILAATRSIYPNSELKTYTISYRGSKLSNQVDESKFADQAAEYNKTIHRKIIFEEEQQFLDSVQKIVEIFSQPFGNATAIVSEKIASSVSKECKVALVGDGGDELLIGYPRYKALPIYNSFNKLPISIISLLQFTLGLLSEKGVLATKIRRIKQFSQELKKPISESFLNWSTYVNNQRLENAVETNIYTDFYMGLIETFERNKDNPLRAAALVDLKSFVPFNLMQSADRTSMTHSLELRSPFLSTRLIKLALEIPSEYKLQKGRIKPLLVDSLSQEIPDFIKTQPKRPFNPPLQGFIRRNVRMVDKYLLSKESQISDIVSNSFVRTEIESFKSGTRDNSTYLWGLMSLECWLRKRANKEY